jgi:hypothetical protein
MSNGTDSTTFLKLLRDNFAVASGIAVVSGVGLATVFLSSYLSVFDWHLIWFIQYTDIITFGLIAVGVLAGSYFLLHVAVQNFLSTGIMTGQLRWKVLAALVLLWLLSLGAQIYDQHLKAEPHYFHVVWAWVAALFAIVFVLFVIKYIRSDTWPKLGDIIAVVFIGVTATVFFGQWLGYSVHDAI